MPTFNELINGFANKQTYKRIQGVVHAGLGDIHNHAVRIKALQSKPGMEGLIAMAFPKLTKLIEEIEDEDRKKAVTRWGDSKAPSENPENIPQGMWGVRYPYSQVPNSGLSSGSPSPATKALHAAFGVDECDRGGKSLEAQSSND